MCPKYQIYGPDTHLWLIMHDICRTEGSITTRSKILRVITLSGKIRKILPNLQPGPQYVTIFSKPLRPINSSKTLIDHLLIPIVHVGGAIYANYAKCALK